MVPRVACEWDEGRVVHLPEDLCKARPWLGRVCELGLRKVWRDEIHPATGQAWEELTRKVLEQRLAYDPELWFWMAARIELDAETREATGEPVGPFVLNRAQRIYMAILQERFFSGEPVRVILLKARQWGGSTLTQLFMAWVQQYWRRAWHIFICALTVSQASHIRGMYQRLGDHYPEPLGSITLLPYQQQTNIRFVPEVESIIGVTSIERPNTQRSFSVHMAHLSEVGLWTSTEKVNAEDYAQSLAGAVPEREMTIVVEESTAKGVGTYFHRSWTAAEEGRSDQVPVFIPWYEIPKYRHAFDGERQRLAFARSMDADEWELWDHGASFEQIQWYRKKLQGFKGKRQRMKSEFPSTPEEAFQSTGQVYFQIKSIQRQRANVRPPLYQGDIRGRANKGAASLDEVRMVARPDGPLKVWHPPGYEWKMHKEGHLYRRRYCGYIDFGGKSDTADWNVLRIFDRAPMTWAGIPVVAAQYRAHMRPDLFIWRCAQIGTWYEEALLAPEINRHRDDRGDEERGYEPEWGLTAILEVYEAYQNLYFREELESADRHEVGLKIGFHLNMQTKPMLVNLLDQALDDELYVERAEEALHELMVFEQRPDGTFGAVAGNHDDIVISTAGGLFLAMRYMDPPTAYFPKKYEPKRHAGAAQF